MLINAGITEIIYIEEYNDPLAAQLLQEAGIGIRKIDIPRRYGRASRKE